MMNQVYRHVYKYLDNMSEHMAIHASFGTIFEFRLVESYRGNHPQMYPKLKYFKAGGKCASIPKFQTLRKLDCKNTKIRAIPILENLQYLDIRGTRVRKLPVLKNLRVLLCNERSISINLHHYPRLINFNGQPIRRPIN